MARERYLVGIDPEELKPKEKTELPMTFGQKVQKFWYNYKALIIVAAVVAVCGVLLAVAVGNKKTYDYTLVLVTSKVVSTAGRDEIAQDLAVVGEDLDGDGQVTVQVLPLNMTDPGDKAELASFFAGGTAVFFGMEPTYYEEYIGSAELENENEHYFTELAVEHEGLSENGRYWNWNGSIATETAEPFPQDLYFGVRLPIGTAIAKKQESADHTALLEKFINASPMA